MNIIERITQSTMSFSKDEWLLELKIKTLLWMLFVSTLVLVLFTFIRFFKGDLTTAATDGVGAIVFIVLYNILKNDKTYYNIVSITSLVIVTLVITVGLFVSGHEILRALWFFAILTLAYYLRDGKEGLIWLTLFISILAYSYYLAQDPNTLGYIMLMLNLILISSVLYFYDKIKLSEQKNLEAQKILLEETVKSRTQELNILNANLQERVLEEVFQNTIKDKMMIQQNKMAMMGEMIGNIAHQFRQPLSAITTTTGAMKFEMELGTYEQDEAKKKLNNIERYVQHLSNTINDFRNFFKEDKHQTTFNLAKSIEQDLFIIESTLVSNNIEIIKHYDEDIEVHLLKNELTQAILNILNNAKDALVDSDTKVRLIFIDIILEDNHPTIIIKDNAGGIPTNVLPKIFEDNFTTKEHNDGTGIGLFMTKQMIENHIGGKIIASNQTYVYNDAQYHGAEFKVVLPK